MTWEEIFVDWLFLVEGERKLNMGLAEDSMKILEGNVKRLNLGGVSVAGLRVLIDEHEKILAEYETWGNPWGNDLFY